MVTVAAGMAPLDTPSGKVLKANATLSPSSSSVSWVAVKVNDFSVSPLSNVTFAWMGE